MSTCDTCHFWQPKHHREAPEGWGECGKAESADGHNATETLAFALDRELYGASLMTLPNFGCVMWEAPPEEMPF